MVGTPNIKINSSMIEDFSSPINDVENRNTYLRVNESGKVSYTNINGIISEIEASGGLSGDIKHLLDIWDNDTTYEKNDVVIYANSIWQCIATSSNHEVFDFDDWRLLAGYSKKSYFYYSGEEEINQIVLDKEVANKESFSVNLNNLVLQSNNYNLETDQKTITFLEPINPDTNIEVVVYGNMIIPTDVSNIVIKNFTATEDQTEFDLNEIILKKELVTVNIENTVIMNSEWELSEDQTKVILKNPVPENTRVQISYFNDIELKIGATFTPEVSKIGTVMRITWSNDGGLENPPNAFIFDGATFTPEVSKIGTNTTLSWENNANLENPDDVVIKDGATYTPHISKEGIETTISWTNDEELENPEDVVIKDGATFTPHTTQDAHEATISFTNDGDLENPEPISIYTNYAQRIVETFTATEGQTEFVASHEIYDKSVLSVNVGNTELTSSAYSLGEDKKTVTLVTGLEAGALVDLKYFYNLNIGTTGTTFTPDITEVTGGYELSWTNDGDLENPESVIITTGKGLNPVGEWSDNLDYNQNDYVTYEDELYSGSYIALKDVPAGTLLTDTTYWMENIKVVKNVVAFIDWGE